MRKFALQAYAFLGSAALTVWLVGLFLFYYLSMAVWSKEAFWTYIGHLSSNNLFRAFYVVFFVNAFLRITQRMRRLWPSRMRFFLQLPLLLGVLLFLLSLFMSLNTRKYVQTQPVGLGDNVALPQSSDQYQIQSVEPAIKKHSLRSEGAAVFDYEPGVTLIDAQGGKHRIGAFPPRLVGSTYMHVLNFGIGPGVELKRKGNTTFKGYVALRLTPFGIVDEFNLPEIPYIFYLSIVPNSTLKKGKETANTYDLDKPRYGVMVVQDEKTILKAETDSSLIIDKDLTLFFHPPSDWVILEIVQDHFLIWLICSLILLCIGTGTYLISLIVAHKDS